MDNKNSKTVKYAEVLKNFVHPTIDEGDSMEVIEKKYAFGVHVWNAANVKELNPEMFERARLQVTQKSHDKTEAEALFDEMVDFKYKEFADYKKVVIDFEVLEKVGGGYNITVASADLKME